jgi:hypothetical protein
LFEKLQEDQNNLAKEGENEELSDVFDIVTRPYIEKLNFLLFKIDAPSDGIGMTFVRFF